MHLVYKQPALRRHIPGRMVSWSTQLILACIAAGPGPVKPIIPDREGTVIHVGKVFQALALAYVIFLALLVKWLKPDALSLTSSIVTGAVLGLAYSLVQAWNKRQRSSLRNLVSLMKRDACNTMHVKDEKPLCHLSQLAVERCTVLCRQGDMSAGKLHLTCWRKCMHDEPTSDAPGCPVHVCFLMSSLKH